MTKSTELLQGTVDLLILKVLSLEPMHGWAIAQRIRQLSKDVLRVNQGALYPALHRLEHQAWIESSWGASENNRRAKYYSLTKAGRKRLAGGRAVMGPSLCRGPRGTESRINRVFMRLLDSLLRRLRSLRQRDPSNVALQEELQFHLQQQTEENMKQWHVSGRGASCSKG